ncbi:AI-2E family transporter [Longimicrobium sp.]|uniref:AI-2E family transporter n=1 Tax=Longimicrobium sp. TaxID=2029185 RepID=UPI002B7D8201|nr:AI-2E family transporter [Longimicrobium sp.]HSU14284.1 AI-2E family transporter [Longimicrobium sp.]
MRPRVIQINITGRAIAMLLAALALVWLVVGFSKILFILFLAILLAVGIDPLVDRMERWKLPRSLAIFLVYLGIMAVLVAAVALLVPVLVEESSQLADSLPKIAQQVGDLAGSGTISIPGVGHVSTAEMGHRLGGEVGSIVASVPRLLVGVGKAVTGVLVSALLVLVVGFFLSADANFAPRFLGRFFSPRVRPTVAELSREISGRLGHWVRAQLLVGAFFGTAFGVGLWLLGVPFALSLGVAGAVLELIPYVGGVTVTAIAMLVALTISPWRALAVLVLEIVVANIESHVLYPKVVGNAVGLHPLTIILALFIGAEAKGIIGALVAVPVAVVLQVVFDRFYRFHDTGQIILPESDLVPAAEPVAVSVTSEEE